MFEHYRKSALNAFHTLRHLKAQQAAYFFLRRKVGYRKTKPWIKEIDAASIQFQAFKRPSQPSLRCSTGSYEFTFLNKTMAFPRGAMDWQPATQRLWTYNLHYFDFLNEEGPSTDDKLHLINDWIAQNRQGLSAGWEPYTASLRIVNWCKFYWSIAGSGPLDCSRWLRSLYDQAHWLEQNIEYHILANHLFENLKALVFAGCCFNDGNARRWRELGEKKVMRQLQEQNLPDGGHYERSPFYHCILLEGYLDLLNLCRANAGFLSMKFEAMLEGVISRSLAWLDNVGTPDDGIPLFNDSVENSALRPSALRGYATLLGIPPPTGSAETTLIELNDTGLYGWKNRSHYFVMDCGDIGPSYQPGHTHCDFLSYVWMANGQWIAVDSGVHEYQPGDLRTYVRSTQAHNTVCIDGADQSEVWGEFRVARRAVKLEAGIEQRPGGIRFSGAYRGFPQLGWIVHRRSVDLDFDHAHDPSVLRVNDHIEGNGRRTRTIDSFIHLHPALDIETEDGTMLIKRQGRIIAVFHTDADSEIIDSIYCPEFGKLMKNKAIRIRSEGELPLGMSYTISLVKQE